MKMEMGGCGDCFCKSCLMYRSSRCPFGGCWDDHRAEVNPWTAHHDKPRTIWTNWNQPGEQAHWCRGGLFYSYEGDGEEGTCPHYIRYEPEKHIVRACLLEVVEVFQDGYIRCGMVNTLGCEECYRRFEEREEAE